MERKGTNSLSERFESARGYNQSNGEAPRTLMATDRLAIKSIRPSTLRMLQPYKKGDMTRDDVPVDFIEEYVPKEFVAEMIRQAEVGPGVPCDRYRKSGSGGVLTRLRATRPLSLRASTPGLRATARMDLSNA